MKATWNEAVIAESDDTVVVEGNHYFPEAALDGRRVRPSDHSSYCPWKGTASYYHVVVDGKVNENACWYYADPKPEAEHVRGRVAFWKGVVVG